MGLELFNIEGEHPRAMKAIVRRFLLWSVVCWISGAPSLVWAMQSPAHDPAAMALGIMLFAVGYTIVTSTDRFDAFQRRPGVRRTLYIGYFTRLGMSVVFPVAMAADLLPGLLSVGAAGKTLALLGIGESSRFAVFFSTLLATCIQGSLLNFLISIYMLLVYGLVRWFGWGMQQQRGFEVILPEALPVAQERGDVADDVSGR